MMKKIYETLLFDLDGTLIDPLQGFSNSINYALNRLAIKFNEPLGRFIGPPLHLTMAHILKTEDKVKVDEAVRLFREYYAHHGVFENTFYPEIAELVDILLERKKKIFVATSKPEVYARQIIENSPLKNAFSKVYGCQLNGDLSNKGELISHLLKNENISPSTAVMIGDREHDIIGANKNSMASLGVLWGYGSKEELLSAGALDVFKAPRGLADFLI